MRAGGDLGARGAQAARSALGQASLTPGVTWAELPRSCLTLCNPMDHNPPGSSVHGMLQARIVGWGVMPSSRASYNIRLF